MPCRKSSSSSIQIKALFILVLLGGHEAVRIHEDVNLAAVAYDSTSQLKPGKDEKAYQDMNKECRAFWNSTCQKEGCEWKPFVLDGLRSSCRKSDKALLSSSPTAVKQHLKMFTGIMEAKATKYYDSCKGKFAAYKPKCMRRIQQMVNAVRFMTLARKKSGDFSEEDREEVKKAFDLAMEKIAAALGEGEAANKLKEKILSSGSLQKDPPGTVEKMRDLMMQVTQGTDEESAKAKGMIERSDAFEPIEAEEALESKEDDGEDMKETEEDSDFDQSLEGVDAVSDVVGEEEETEPVDDGDEEAEEKALSALQVRNSMQLDKSDAAGALLVLLVVGATVFAFSLIATALAYALVGFALISLVGCFAYHAGRYSGAKGVDETETDEKNATAVAVKEPATKKESPSGRLSRAEESASCVLSHFHSSSHSKLESGCIEQHLGRKTIQLQQKSLNDEHGVDFILLCKVSWQNRLTSLRALPCLSGRKVGLSCGCLTVYNHWLCKICF